MASALGEQQWKSSLFYVSEKQLHTGIPLHEWFLEEARALGIPGGSTFRAIAGYGRHGRLHEETFFELAGELAVRVESGTV